MKVRLQVFKSGFQNEVEIICAECHQILSKVIVTFESLPFELPVRCTNATCTNGDKE